MSSVLIGPPKVAVCLAAYNGMNFIREQVDSILKQINVSINLFVSVDRSTDGTESYFQLLSKNDRRVSLLETGNIFGGAGPNFFHLLKEIDFSEFDYIAFADQDDIWCLDKLIRAHSMLVSTGASGYSSNVIAFWPDGRRKLISKSQPQRRWDFLFEAAGPGCTYVLTRDLACSIKNFIKLRFDDVIKVSLHDWFTYAYARANGFIWIIDSYAGLYYRQHSENQVGVNVGWSAFIYRVNKVLNGWGISQAFIISNILNLDEENFVKMWKSNVFFGFLWLAYNSNLCRRSKVHQVYFFLACIILAFKTKKFIYN